MKHESDLAAVIAGASMWHVETADALELAEHIPDASVDVVAMDPPFCSGGYNEAEKRRAKGQGLRSETLRKDGWFINDNMGTAGLVWLVRCLAVQSYRILRDGGSLCMFTDWRMVPSLAPAIESSGLRQYGMPIWDKGSFGLGVGFRHQYETILHFVKGTGVFYRKDLGDVLRHPRVSLDEREHQTEKPEGLMADIVTLCAPPGGLGVDFFTGSGPTGAACIRNGIRFVGSEISAANADKARRRLAAAASGLSLADAERGQTSIFDVIGRAS